MSASTLIRDAETDGLRLTLTDTGALKCIGANYDCRLIEGGVKCLTQFERTPQANLDSHNREMRLFLRNDKWPDVGQSRRI